MRLSLNTLSRLSVSSRSNIVQASRPRFVSRAVLPSIRPIIGFNSNLNTGSIRSYASESEPSNKQLLDQLTSKTDVMDQLMADQQAVELFQKMSTYVETQGYTTANPPGKLAMMKFVMDPEFRNLMSEMKSVVERLNISAEASSFICDLQMMQKIGMDMIKGFKK
ncbi:hypothetical protein [Phaffia rhodozyma]|uniref:Uncharacterized protein n=1 Tax=Phaffia rhodozyma TaxID=264483 RepID=A0A0F7STJ0_PHARH|nr:hypothetical protein [Phaffia rhodozyma]